MDNLVYWVWLSNLSGIFSNKITSLLERFNSVEEIYKSDMNGYFSVPGLSRGDALVLNNKDLTRAKEIVEATFRMGAKILTYEDINYPDCLRTIDNPPYVLYVKGEVVNWDRLLMISVVGTRECSEYGAKAAHHLSYALARNGVTIVSGMARGIDSVASRAALKAGGKTVVVLGCGLDIVYPPENKKLMGEIEKNGTIITEYPPGSRPLSHHFPERNRIINGLAKGVLIVEAPYKSGALITANYALENGRDLFAVPGSIFKDNSYGTNLLIKQGAKLVTSAMDILEEYPTEVSKLNPLKIDNTEDEKNIKQITIDDEKYAACGDDEKKIISLLIEGNMHIEDIRARLGIDIGKLNSILPMLEMMGLIKKIPGDNYKLEV